MGFLINGPTSDAAFQEICSSRLVKGISVAQFRSVMHGQRRKDTPLKNHCTFRMISSLSEKIALCGKLLYQTMHLIQRIQHELINPSTVVYSSQYEGYNYRCMQRIIIRLEGPCRKSKWHRCVFFVELAIISFTILELVPEDGKVILAFPIRRDSGTSQVSMIQFHGHSLFTTASSSQTKSIFFRGGGGCTQVARSQLTKAIIIRADSLLL